MKYKLKTSILCFGVPLCQAHLWFFGGDALPSSSMASSGERFAKLIYGKFDKQLFFKP